MARCAAYVAQAAGGMCAAAPRFEGVTLTQGLFSEPRPALCMLQVPCARGRERARHVQLLRVHHTPSHEGATA